MIKNKNRIKSLMEGLYAGPNWVSVDILSTLEGLNSEQATRRVLPQSNTIWEILNHMIGWREHVLRRLAGEELPSPDHNYIEEITDTSDEAWAKTLKRLEETQKAWETFLINFKEDHFDNVYPPSGTSHYVLVHGIIQHDYYHLGQIKMLARYV